MRLFQLANNRSFLEFTLIPPRHRPVQPGSTWTTLRYRSHYPGMASQLILQPFFVAPVLKKKERLGCDLVPASEKQTLDYRQALITSL